MVDEVFTRQEPERPTGTGTANGHRAHRYRWTGAGAGTWSAVHRHSWGVIAMPGGRGGVQLLRSLPYTIAVQSCTV